MASIALGSQYEDFIESQLKAGRYDTATEVLEAGLRMLEEFEDAREQWINDEIPARYNELRGDTSRAVPAETVRARFEAKHQSRLAASK